MKQYKFCLLLVFILAQISVTLSSKIPSNETQVDPQSSEEMERQKYLQARIKLQDQVNHWIKKNDARDTSNPGNQTKINRFSNVNLQETEENNGQQSRASLRTSLPDFLFEDIEGIAVSQEQRRLKKRLRKMRRKVQKARKRYQKTLFQLFKLRMRLKNL